MDRVTGLLKNIRQKQSYLVLVVVLGGLALSLENGCGSGFGSATGTSASSLGSSLTNPVVSPLPAPISSSSPKFASLEITDYCSSAQIATDITQCAQNAIDAATALGSVSYGGARIHFPARYSPYTLLGTLAINSSYIGLYGDAQQGTFINCSNGGLDCLTVGSADGLNIRDVSVAWLGIWGSNKNAGSGIHLFNSFRTLIDNVDLENMTRGLDIEALNNGVTIQNSNIVVNQPGSDYGIYWHAAPTSSSSRSDVVTLYNVVIEGQWSNATGIMWTGFSNTIVGSSIRILHMNYGIRVMNPSESPSYFPTFANFHDLEMEGFKTRALSIEAGAEFRLTGSDINNLSKGASGQGGGDDYAVACYADAAGSYTRGLMIANSRIGDSQKSGLYTECRGTQLDNVQFFSTSLAGRGQFPVILVAPQAQDSTFSNIVCEEFGGTGLASNCLYVSNGATNIKVGNFVTNYLNSSWFYDPGNAATFNSPHLAGGTFSPLTDLAHSGIRQDQNADTIFKVVNGQSGSQVTARFDLATATANSYLLTALRDNGGAPSFLQAAGPGVLNATWQMPNYNFTNSSGSSMVYITAAGNLGIGTTAPKALLQVNGSALASAWNTPSDRRFKTNITEIEDPLEKILSLRGVEFDWREDVITKMEQRHDIGIIAQEVEKVFPEVVSVDSNGYRSVAYSKLISPLIEAVKEMWAKVALQDERIARLEKDNAEMKAALCQMGQQAFCAH